MADQKQRVGTFTPVRAEAINKYVHDMQGTREGSGPSDPTIRPTKKVWGQITGSIVEDGIVKHSWKQVRWSFGDSAFEDAPDGIVGEDVWNCIINHPNPATAIAIDTIVHVSRQDDQDTGENIWTVVASGGSSSGLITGQVFQVVTENVSAWQFFTAHSIT